MAPFGYLFVLVGALLIRQVAVGRVADLPTDAKDFALALLSGKPDELGEIMARRGTNVAGVTESGSATGEFSDSVGDLVASATSSAKGTALAKKVRELGNSATGYKLGAVGPTYYDCSGLIWKAAYLLKFYTGSRFTTASFTSIADSWCESVTTPAVGDIVLWSGAHMGICVGDDRMYSARSPAKGIGESSISGDSTYFGKPPTYWRLK